MSNKGLCHHLSSHQPPDGINGSAYWTEAQWVDWSLAHVYNLSKLHIEYHRTGSYIQEPHDHPGLDYYV